METIVEIRALTKTYGQAEKAYQALRGVDLTLREGEFSILAGPSGCGKTTLLSIIGGVLGPTSGTVEVLGHDLTRATETELEDFRLLSVGFIFQGHNLLSFLSARENVATILEMRAVPRRQALETADRMLERVNLNGKERSMPRDLSIGQQQRVAIARAIAGQPRLVLADEPTASLDAANGIAAIQLLRDIAEDGGKTVLVVTHDSRIFSLADRVIQMEDGRILKEEHPK